MKGPAVDTRKGVKTTRHDHEVSDGASSNREIKLGTVQAVKVRHVTKIITKNNFTVFLTNSI